MISLVALCILPLTQCLPLKFAIEDDGVQLLSGILVVALVLVAGLSSGLTIGLISLDETNLRILEQSDSEFKKYAKKIIPIRKKGYLLLITLLIINTVQEGC